MQRRLHPYVYFVVAALLGLTWPGPQHRRKAPHQPLSHNNQRPLPTLRQP